MRFRQIDDAVRGDHYHLTTEDDCYFLHEYTSGQKFAHSAGNQLIGNLKKPVARRGRPEYRYKGTAIAECAMLLAGALHRGWLARGTLVPVPPSKIPGDPAYDDRMLQVCRALVAKGGGDLRELVRQDVSLRAAHESGADRPSPQELARHYRIDESVTAPAPVAIAVVDDVLTAGSHFRAMKQVLSGRFPDVPVVGLFIARRVFPTDRRVDTQFSWF